jgi:hypothetical protein
VAVRCFSPIPACHARGRGLQTCKSVTHLAPNLSSNQGERTEGSRSHRIVTSRGTDLSWNLAGASSARPYRCRFLARSCVYRIICFGSLCPDTSMTSGIEYFPDSTRRLMPSCRRS